MAKERPILFIAPMVRAILEGRKTQTRRIVNPQPECYQHADWPGSPNFRPRFNTDGSLCCGICMGKQQRLTRHDVTGIRNPYGKPGDRLWVRESFQPLLADGVDWNDADYETGEGYAIKYEATSGAKEFYDCKTDEAFCSRITPSIHMPRWASRITLEITDVRVQRLQEISEKDSIAEGIERLNTDVGMFQYWKSYNFSDAICESPRDCFASLWASINGRMAWKENPWVWALTFRRLEVRS